MVIGCHLEALYFQVLDVFHETVSNFADFSLFRAVTFARPPILAHMQLWNLTNLHEDAGKTFKSHGLIAGAAAQVGPTVSPVFGALRGHSRWLSESGLGPFSAPATPKIDFGDFHDHWVKALVQGLSGGFSEWSRVPNIEFCWVWGRRGSQNGL